MALASLTETPRLRQVVARGLEMFHEHDPEVGCERACYDCLLSFYNQLVHEALDRRLVMPFLRSVQDVVVERLQVATGGPTLQELEAQCQSGLERQVLRAIQERGLPLPDAAQKTLYEGDEPIAIADFFYEPNIVVFVDGSPHYLDYVSAADDRKRKRLKAKGYRVVVIKVEDAESGLIDLSKRLQR